MLKIKKVFIVKIAYDSTLGVFSTKRKAQIALSKYNKAWMYSENSEGNYIDEYVLDDYKVL